MAVTLGSKGLLNADIVIVQSVSFSCTFVHETSDGEPIDHSGWSAWCKIQGGSLDLDLGDRVAFSENGEIVLLIPDDITATMPVGTYSWDLIIKDTLGYSIRIAYGNARVYDSYAKD